MTRIRGFFIFYQSFFLYPAFIITLCGCYLYYKNSHYGIMPPIIAMKLITMGMAAYLAYDKKELYCYYNLGLSYRTLVVLACSTDLLLFTAGIKITKYLL